jgi:hypothetical protein
MGIEAAYSDHTQLQHDDIKQTSLMDGADHAPTLTPCNR